MEIRDVKRSPGGREQPKTHESPDARRAGQKLGAAVAGILLAAFLGIALNVYEPVMEGGFVSDDWPVIVNNPYVQELTLENVGILLQPFGPPIAYSMNYAPVHLLLHALEVETLGQEIRRYHLVNLVLHAVTAMLLTVLLVSSRLPVALAGAGGALFLLHPANVEAVAVIVQAKTVLSTALALGALLALWRFPALAAGLFGLALLTKITAAFALPAAAVMVWTRAADAERRVPHWGWLVLWTVLLLAVAVPELAAFRRTGQHVAGMGEDWLVQGRSIAAVAMRYLVMAVSSYGLSAFHQPEPARSWLDPWWLGGVVALLLLAWRSLVALRRRDEEAAYWVMAAVSFAPVSQVFPFMYPMADRYLYTILPGLIGGGLLAAREVAAVLEPRLRGWLGARAPNSSLTDAAVAVIVLSVALGFASRSHERVGLFQSEMALRVESARNYPHGIQARIFEAEGAGRVGDAQAAAEALESLRQQGFMSYAALAANPNLAPVLGDRAVQAVFEDMALYWIERLRPLEDPFQIELHTLAQAYIVRGELSNAILAMETALEMGGPHDAELRTVLKGARREEQRRRRSVPTPEVR